MSGELVGRLGSRDSGYSLPNYKRGTETTKAVAHDLFGRVTTDTLDTFSWTILSELRSVTANSGSTSTSEQYQYDGLGRMVARLTPAGAVTEEYAYDGAQMVGAWSGPQALVWSATWGPGLDNLVAIKLDSTTYLAIADGRGSIGGFVHEGTQRVASTLDYTPEGRVQWQNFSSGGTATNGCSQLANPLADCDAGPNAIPFGFHSAFKSPGSGLVYFRNRWLSTRTGEWLSQDPLGPVDSTNLYSFSAFDPVNWRDSMGLERKGASGITMKVGESGLATETSATIVQPPLMSVPASKGMTSPARASESDRADSEQYLREVQQAGLDFLKFEAGIFYGTVEGVTPGASMVAGPPISAGPRPFSLGRAIGNILGGLIDLLLSVGTEGGGIISAPVTGPGGAVAVSPVAAALAVNGTVSIGRGAGALIDLAVQSSNNGGKGPPGAQPPPAANPAPGPAPVSPQAPGGTPAPPASQQTPLKPEAKYTGSKKHGVDWKEGPAQAKKENMPQGQWGSKADVDWASREAAAIAPGQSAWVNLPSGHTSVVHKPDGSTVKASKAWIRNNGTGTWHGYPAE